MFYAEGWVPLSDVALAARRRITREVVAALRKFAPESRPSVEEWEAEISTKSLAEIRNICEDAKSVGVLLANGRVALVSKQIFAPSSLGDMGSHVDVFDGRVGSADWLRDLAVESRPAYELTLADQYGPFARLPVLLSEECLGWAQNGLPAEEAVETLSHCALAPAAVAREIVAAYDTGLKLRRDEYRKTYAPGMSMRAYDAAWKLAVAERPLLSKPGRRPEEI